MLHFLAPLFSHVPTYGGGVEGCFTPPHHHTTSQVIYIKGSGGLEIHCSQNGSCPFDLDGGEILDVDAVFRDQVDQSTYSLYIGCGGCVPSEDKIVIPPVKLHGYEPAELEPFTQTQYSSVFAKADRKYNSSGLRYDVCDQGHFTIRLLDYGNRTDGSVLFWAPVIGLGETFTMGELLSFGAYILMNHGATWNEQGWTYPVVLFVVGVLMFVDLWGRELRTGVVDHGARALFYQLSILGFLAAAIEIFIHTVYAQVGATVNYGFWVSILGVGIIANGIPMWFASYVWRVSAYYIQRENRKKPQVWIRICGGNVLPGDWHTYYIATAHPLWAPLEFLTGFSCLFFFGAGFYLGPTSIMIAALYRHIELYRWWVGDPYGMDSCDTPKSPKDVAKDKEPLLLLTLKEPTIPAQGAPTPEVPTGLPALYFAA